MSSEYTVRIMDSAADCNDAVEEYLTQNDRLIRFSSKEDAEEFPSNFSSDDDTEVRIQEVPPNETRDIDAYLIPDNSGNSRETKQVGSSTWEVDIGANEYGWLAESLITSYNKNPAPIMPFIRNDIQQLSCDDTLENSLDNLHVFVEDRPARVGRWEPDCLLTVKTGYRSGDIIKRYWCEIKGGDSSFERRQLSSMQEKAEEDTVLKIRVWLDQLPKRYRLKIDKLD